MSQADAAAELKLMTHTEGILSRAARLTAAQADQTSNLKSLRRENLATGRPRAARRL